MDGSTIVAAITAVTALAAWFTDSRLKRREAARNDVVAPMQAISASAATLVGAMEQAITPLRAEIADLRTEVVSLRHINARLEARVRELTDLLRLHGVDVPEPPRDMRP